MILKIINFIFLSTMSKTSKIRRREKSIKRKVFSFQDKIKTDYTIFIFIKIILMKFINMLKKFYLVGMVVFQEFFEYFGHLKFPSLIILKLN